MPLTAHQQIVANHDRDHALCIAVAGSGKTTTLAHLINNLLNKGHPSRRIMVMMFNKAAQQDFQKKLKAICTTSSTPSDTGHLPLPEVRTYHATGLRLLRTLEGWQVREPYHKQPLSEKVIELQVRALIQALAPASIQERMRSDAARYIEAATGFIDNVKANLTTPEDWFETAGFASEHRFMIKLFHQFEQWRHHQKSITFTDMLYDPVRLLTENPELVSRIENKMDFIIVDEYQDTSTLQHRFTRLIAGDRANVIAVGDPDQTIYEFAGANINNILSHFQQDYGVGMEGSGIEAPGGKTVHELTLPHTFRYGHSIALAASHLISQNRARKKVLCIAHEENRPSIIRLSQESDDSRAVVRELQGCLLSGTPPGDIAILVRVWAQSVNIELSLLENGITYTCEGPSLFQRPELETLVFALQMAAGWFSHCEPDVRGNKLTRMLTLPHIGLKQHALHGLMSALQPLDRGYGKAMERQVSRLKGITDFQRRRLQDRARVFRYLEHAGQQESAHKILATYIQQSELYDNLRSMSLNEQRTEEQILAIKGFQRFIKPLGEDAHTCCGHIEALMQKQQHKHHSPSNAVTLSSCHRAKGLEWPVVLLPGLTRQYWPFLRDDDLAMPSPPSASCSSLEAERRLLYVGMTRAQSQLHLFTCPGNLDRSLHNLKPDWGKNRQETISPFLMEMNLPHVLELGNLLHDSRHKESDDDLAAAITATGLTTVSRHYAAAARPALAGRIKQASAIETQPIAKEKYQREQKTASRSNASSAGEPWQLKARIEHAIFGPGNVINVTDTSFSIAFDSQQHGTKRFARHPDIRHLFKVIQ